VITCQDGLPAVSCVCTNWAGSAVTFSDVYGAISLAKLPL